jgi:hypothetical protein
LRVGIDGVGERVVTAAFEPGPVEIAFDAEHQRLDLPIGADLAAADEATLAERVVRAGKRVAPRGTGEAGAEIAADIDSRLVIDRWCIGDRGHRRRPARRRQIGGLRRTNANASGNNCAGGERNAADERTRIHAHLQPLFPTLTPLTRGEVTER